MNKLAILIPTIVGREAMLARLLRILEPQVEQYPGEVGIISLCDDRQITIGAKRNRLTELAIEQGYTHRAFIDDDDTVTDNYLDLNMPGVRAGYDCNSLIGIYTVNGLKDPKKHIFIHSLRYTHWFEDAHTYYRNPNHLNVIKLACIKDIKFPEQNFGEDGQFSEQLHAKGVLKTEYEIKEPFYNYLFRNKPNGI